MRTAYHRFLLALTFLIFVFPIKAFGQQEAGDDAYKIIATETDLYDASSERKTRYGTLSVLEDEKEGGKRLFFEGKPLDLHDYSLRIAPIIQDGDTDLALIQVITGGNACPATFALAVANKEGARLIETDSGCSESFQLVQKASLLLLLTAPDYAGERRFILNKDGVHDVTPQLREFALKEMREEVRREKEVILATQSGKVSTDERPIINPPLQADQRIYRWCGLIEHADISKLPTQGSLVVSINRTASGALVIVPSSLKNAGIDSGSRPYKFLFSIKNKYITPRKSYLQASSKVCAIGRYNRNQSYEAEDGQQRLMPVLDVSLLFSVR